MRVEGTGNVKLFPRPSVTVPWATLVAGEERVRVEQDHWGPGPSILDPRVLESLRAALASDEVLKPAATA